jgi:16S rRNA (cytosine1402-N4)-methyltransferase
MQLALRAEEIMPAEAVPHRPVMLRETLQLLRPAPGAIVVDGTLGAGGHAEALLGAIAPHGRLYGIDRDPTALAHARERLAPFGDRFTAIHGDHRELPLLLEQHGVDAVDTVLLDLGISSMQLDDPSRGFALTLDGPLDMRMDPGAGPSAAELLQTLPESEIASILYRFGQERRSRAIARAIVRQRADRPLCSTSELRELVERVMGPQARRFKIHPATRTFQAVRIAVNHELVGLDVVVSDCVRLLRPGGRVAFIAFHSLEDRAVKHTLRGLAQSCVCPPGLPVCLCEQTSQIRVLTTRVVRPTEQEIRDNPRSRSARLRVGEKR